MKTEKENTEINEIEVREPEILVCGSATTVCYPEEFFERIEMCRLCGRCV